MTDKRARGSCAHMQYRLWRYRKGPGGSWYAPPEASALVIATTYHDSDDSRKEVGLDRTEAEGIKGVEIRGSWDKHT